MAFTTPPPEFTRHFNEPRLSKVPVSPSLYDRRNARQAIDDKPYYPATSSDDNTGEMGLSEKMGVLEITQPPANSVVNLPGQRQVKELVHVIEAAEYAIRNQMEENEQLRSALRDTEWELQNSKMEHHGVPRAIDDRPHDPYHLRQGAQRGGILPAVDRHGHLLSNLRSASNRDGYAVAGLHEDQQGSIIIHPTAGQPLDYQNGVSLLKKKKKRNGGSHSPPPAESLGRRGGASNGSNGGPNPHHRGGHPHLAPIVDTNSSGVSSPSSRSLSPTQARRRDAELEARPETGQGLSQLPSDVNTSHNGYHPSDVDNGHNGYHTSDVNDNHNAYHQQEMTLRGSRTQEEEISLLHKRLTEASIKEAQVLSEKRILERRVAELRLAYDQQQQGLVDAASKALSYRQDVLEENIRLTYALQAADTERSVYISSLLPLLAEFDLQPTVADAHSMVSAIKILVQHLRSELNLSEMQGKKKDPLFRQQWRPDLQYHSSGQYPRQSPPRGNLHGLEIVPQQLYTHPQMPSSPPSPAHHANTWDSPATSSQFPAMANDHAQFGGSEPLIPPESMPHGNHFQQEPFLADDGHESQGFDRPADSLDTDELLTSGPHGVSEEVERSPHMPTLPEETTSEDGDPLPAIKALQIVGDALLGGRLTACGHSINGTALCMFQWVRHYQNGTTKYIEGAAQPEYTITADDCDTMIAIECVPMDERNRRGKLVTIFANGSRWITCDSMMQDQIDHYNDSGHASFDVQFVVQGGPPEDNWEPATLNLKRNSYDLRRNSSTRRGIPSEKLTSDVSIKIPVGQLTQCVIKSHEGKSYYLEFRDSRNRDVAVLTFRLFQKMALDGKRGRRRGGLHFFK